MVAGKAVSSAVSLGPLPLVAIAGRPNVGKSTLFNRLTRTRKALVHPLPGVTRDWLAHEVEHEGRRFLLVDTGGLVESVKGDPFTPIIWRAAEEVLRAADVVLFVTDARQGVVAADEIIAAKLRRMGANVLLVVNKTDGARDEAAAREFHQLGFVPLLTTSAEHGRGVDDLLDAVAKRLPRVSRSAEESRSESHEPNAASERSIAVAVVGRPNVGKSSLLNMLVGSERLLVSETAGTTRDAVDVAVTRGGRRFTFVDTAGIRKKARVDARLEALSVLAARRALERADAAVLTLDSAQEVSHQDLAIARLVRDANVACVIALSKADLAPPDASPEDMLTFLRGRIPFLDFAPVVVTSAARGKGSAALLRALARSADARRLRIPTAQVNRDLKDILAANPPPAKGKGAFKIFYATQAATAPPVFVLFVNRPEALTENYLRYVERELRARHPLEGTPLTLRVKARESEQRRGRRGRRLRGRGR